MHEPKLTWMQWHSQRYSDAAPPLRLVSQLSLVSTIVVLALTLMGCGGSTSLDSRPVVELRGADAPAALTMPCEGPVSLIDKPMSAGETERTWARDRSSLAACAAAQAAIVDYYKLRDTGLSQK